MGRSSTSAFPAAEIPTVEAKLRAPSERAGIVPRTRLIERMLRHDERVISVVAPPGYGKTTVLAQWAAQQPHDAAWVSIDETDNDPFRLLASVATAVSTARPLQPATIEAIAWSDSIPTALTRLTRALSSADGQVTVVLDHVEALDNPESLDVVAALAWRLPAGSRLAIGSRRQLPIPTSILRSQGNLLDIGTDDLALDLAEAQALLVACGVELDTNAVSDLVAQTEGWPVGIYLAALAARSSGGSVNTALTFTGSDVLMAEYIRDQVLGNLPVSTASFLTRTSVLDHLSGPLCDAVTDSNRSQATLDNIASSNLLLVPLDRTGHWFRYHRLLRQLLHAELERDEPELVPVLHRRAARWFESQHAPEPAIAHAQLANDPDHVAQLVALNVQPTFAAGRASVARRWFEWFRSEHLIDRYPYIAVFGAWLDANGGRAASAEQWTAIAEASGIDGVLPDGSRLDGWLAYLRAVLCRDGPTRMREDAQLAQELLPPLSGLHPGVRVFEGLSHVMEGDVDAAERVFTHTYDMAVHVNALPAASTAAAERALIALDRGAWDEARRYVEHARRIVGDLHLDDYVGTGLVYAAAARLAIHDGDARSAREHVTDTARLRPLYTYAVPASALIQLELIRLYIQLDDPRGARTVLAEMRDIIRLRPDLGTIPAAAEHLAALLGGDNSGPRGPSSLTKAELRLLPYLGTHLSFREIGARLFVSHHTVKTQATAVYRKLGVSSRGEAVEYLQKSGLLGR